MLYARERMDSLFTPAGSLLSLGAAAFLAATVVPFSSEAVLFAVLRTHGDLFWPALVIATAGNTAGGMSSYLVGRFLGAKKPLTQLERMRRWGTPALVFAWLPLIGDALCIAAGWLKLNGLQATLWQAAGRFARYWAVAQSAGA